MKTFKKLLATLLSVLMLMPMVANFAMFSYADDNAATEPEEVFSGEVADVIDTSATEESEIQPSENVDIVNSGTCGDDLTWNLDAEGTLSITGTGDMNNFSFYNSTPWYVYASDIKSLVIDDGVTSISSWAFYDCTSLDDITIPDSVTSIGYWAFSNTAYEKDSNNWEDGVLYIGKHLIVADSSISGSYDVKEGTICIAENSFMTNTSLTSITIPDSVIGISVSAFQGCTSLANISIGDGVTRIGAYAFYNTAYYNNSSNWENGTLYIGNYIVATNIVISGSYVIKDGTKCIVDKAYYGYGSKGYVIIPDSVVGIGSRAFYYEDYNEHVSKMCDITILCYEGSYAHTYAVNNGYKYQLISADNILASGTCGDDLTWEINGVGELTISGTGDMYEQWGDMDGLIKSVVIGDGVTSIGDYAFYGCTSLDSITIPDSVTSIGYKAFYNTAYYNNTSNWEQDVLYIGKHLISFGSINDSYEIKDGTICIAGGAFDSCSSLESITIPDSVISIGNYAFDYCSSLVSVTIPDSVASIGNCAFNSCSSLESITIPDSVTSIGNYAFQHCSTLESITIPDSVTSIGNYAFNYCSTLESITIPDSVTSIGEEAFYGCSKLAVRCYEDSYAHTYAVDNGLAYEFIIPEEVSGTCGNNLTWTIGSDGVLNITGTGNMYGFLAHSWTPWFGYESYIKSVVIDDGVTSIGQYAFSLCTSLTNVTIPDSVTSIGSSAFDDCSSLKTVTIPYSVTSIGQYAFSLCTSLTNVTIPDSVTSIGSSAFDDCSSLKTVTIPYSVTSIGDDAFYGCEDLTIRCYEDSYAYTYAVDNGIRYELISTVQVIASGVCGDDLTWTLDTEGTLSITGTGDMENFDNWSSEPWCDYCDDIKSVNIGDSVTSIGNNAFKWCNSLVSVAIGSSVTNIGDSAFRNCTALASATIPDSVVSIGDGAFYNCSSLTSMTIPDSVTTLGGGTFMYCSSLTSVIIGNGITSLNSSEFSLCGLVSVTIPDSVTSIGGSAFYSCFNLVSVTIPDSVTSIGDNAFFNCSKLVSVTIPDSVASIGSWAFGGCGSLTSITIPASVTNINTAAFSNCTALENLTVDENNQNYSSDENGILYNKDKTELVQYPNGNTRTSFIIPDFVTSIGDYAFSYCSNLVGVTIPDSVITVGYSAFSYCTSLTDMTIPNSVTAIDSGVFSNCTSLVSVNIPDSVTSIGGAAFNGCSSLTDIILPDSVTSIGMMAFMGTAYYNDPDNWADDVLYIGNHFVMAKSSLSGEYAVKEGTLCIGEFAFVGCSSLTDVIFPDSVTNVNNYAFQGCTSLTDVTVIGVDTIIGDSAFFNCYTQNITIHCQVNSYAHAFAVDNGFKYDFIEEPLSVSSDGLKITVDGISDIKDFFIAKGEFDSYNEIKTNGYIVRVTSAKIADKHNYTYTVTDPGMHTVLVRYNDGREFIFHEELTVDEPVFTTNGLQVTISNIPDVKVIRTAYGEYYTPGDTKRAEGARNYSNKSVIKDAEEYTLQYREEGRVTIVVEYNNGYVKVFHYDVTKKAPTLEQNGNTVTFGNLEGLKVVRYAMGEYTTSGEIKRASGSQYIKPDSIIDGKITVTDLAVGTYTFCVQYDDESYNYYTVIVE